MSLASALVVTVAATGCGWDTAEFASGLDRATLISKPRLPISLRVEEPPASTPVTTKTSATHQPPYPNRVDPFQFGIEVASESTSNQPSSFTTAKLYGFVGGKDIDTPSRAIVHMGSETRMLHAGDHWGALEILEVTPPTVRIRMDGVARTWSLLGEQATQK